MLKAFTILWAPGKRDKQHSTIAATASLNLETARMHLHLPHRRIWTANFCTATGGDCHQQWYHAGMRRFDVGEQTFEGLMAVVVMCTGWFWTWLLVLISNVGCRRSLNRLILELEIQSKSVQRHAKIDVPARNTCKIKFLWRKCTFFLCPFSKAKSVAEYSSGMKGCAANMIAQRLLSLGMLYNTHRRKFVSLERYLASLISCPAERSFISPFLSWSLWDLMAWFESWVWWALYISFVSNRRGTSISLYLEPPPFFWRFEVETVPSSYLRVHLSSHPIVGRGLGYDNTCTQHHLLSLTSVNLLDMAKPTDAGTCPTGALW